MKNELVFLSGFMGCGKSTYGKLLAELLNYDFIDLDEYIEQKYHLSITELFNKIGEVDFRDSETQALHEILLLPNSKVISLGGGTPCFNNNLELIKSNGVLVYIKLEPNQLFERLKHAKLNRPLLAEKNNLELLSYITETLKTRMFFYEQAHITLNGATLEVNHIKHHIELFKR